ncbi:MAG: Holliday junction resolvase RuvX [Clostridia bacterium]
MRKIALDIGDVRIGIAVSDMLGMIAGGTETYTRRGMVNDMRYIADYCKAREADTIVLGLPINMDGSEGERAIKTREFAEELQKHTDAKIVFQDERLTTVQAERMLIDGGVRRDKRKKVVDKVAAAIILQSYLDRINY